MFFYGAWGATCLPFASSGAGVTLSKGLWGSVSGLASLVLLVQLGAQLAYAVHTPGLRRPAVQRVLALLGIGEAESLVGLLVVTVPVLAALLLAGRQVRAATRVGAARSARAARAAADYERGSRQAEDVRVGASPPPSAPDTPAAGSSSVASPPPPSHRFSRRRSLTSTSSRGATGMLVVVCAATAALAAPSVLALPSLLAVCLVVIRWASARGAASDAVPPRLLQGFVCVQTGLLYWWQAGLAGLPALASVSRLLGLFELRLTGPGALRHVLATLALVVLHAGLGELRRGRAVARERRRAELLGGYWRSGERAPATPRAATAMTPPHRGHRLPPRWTRAGAAAARGASNALEALGASTVLLGAAVAGFAAIAPSLLGGVAFLLGLDALLAAGSTRNPALRSSPGPFCAVALLWAIADYLATALHASERLPPAAAAAGLDDSSAAALPGWPAAYLLALATLLAARLRSTARIALQRSPGSTYQPLEALLSASESSSDVAGLSPGRDPSGSRTATAATNANTSTAANAAFAAGGGGSGAPGDSRPSLLASPDARRAAWAAVGTALLRAARALLSVGLLAAQFAVGAVARQDALHALYVLLLLLRGVAQCTSLRPRVTEGVSPAGRSRALRALCAAHSALLYLALVAGLSDLPAASVPAAWRQALRDLGLWEPTAWRDLAPVMGLLVLSSLHAALSAWLDREAADADASRSTPASPGAFRRQSSRDVLREQGTPARPACDDLPFLARVAVSAGSSMLAIAVLLIVALDCDRSALGATYALLALVVLVRGGRGQRGGKVREKDGRGGRGGKVREKHGGGGAEREEAEEKGRGGRKKGRREAACEGPWSRSDSISRRAACSVAQATEPRRCAGVRGSLGGKRADTGARLVCLNNKTHGRPRWLRNAPLRSRSCFSPNSFLTVCSTSLSPFLVSRCRCTRLCAVVGRSSRCRVRRLQRATSTRRRR